MILTVHIMGYRERHCQNYANQGFRKKSKLWRSAEENFCETNLSVCGRGGEGEE